MAKIEADLNGLQHRVNEQLNKWLHGGHVPLDVMDSRIHQIVNSVILDQEKHKSISEDPKESIHRSSIERRDSVLLSKVDGLEA